MEHAERSGLCSRPLRDPSFVLFSVNSVPLPLRPLC
jgi:hypothetical protein